MSNFTLQYDNDGYYHIHTDSEEAELLIGECIHIKLPETQNNTNTVSHIVGRLEALIEMNQQAAPFERVPTRVVH